MKRIILLMLLTAPLFLFANNNQSATRRLKIVVSGFNSDEGLARAGIYFNKAGKKISQELPAGYNMVAEIQNHTALFVLNQLHQGKYAISVMHDSNNNRNLDFNWMGLSNRTTWISNNPTILFGSPVFEECQVSVKEGEETVVNISLK